MSYQPAERWGFTLSLSILMFIESVPLFAAPPKPVVNRHLAVDLVNLKSGRSLRGAIVWRESDGALKMAVSREWLLAANPMTISPILKENQNLRRLAWTQTRERIAERLKATEDPPQLSFFLKQELSRLNELTANPMPGEPDFYWIDLPNGSISKIVKANPEQQQIALVAWNERLNQVETRDANSLSKELAAKGIKLDKSAPDLSDRLPARPQNDAEWAARMALVEYMLVKPLDFQGIGDTLTPTVEGQSINFADVLPKLFQAQVRSFLKDLVDDAQSTSKPEESPQWLKSAIQQAEAQKINGFRATRVEINAAESQVTVHSRFVAQIATGRWDTLWQTSIMEEGTKPRLQSEARIESDPQLQPAMEALKSMGIGDPKTLQQAIRFGAATIAAQESADAQFSVFRERYSRHLDTPPLWLIRNP